MIGPTGSYPDGKLNENDEGELKMVITIESGNVLILFGKPTSWIGFRPEGARELANFLIIKAQEIESEVEPK